jgi:precorrin-2 dehydrogenase/sirohydrochlorin ferrochelatase
MRERFAYPISLDLGSRPCLVVGGGPVAEGKVEGLLAAGAAVTVVSPLLTPALAAHARGLRIRHRARAYRRSDLAGHQLVFTATGDQTLTRAVARDARARGLWMNAADDPERCDFALPSVLRRGRLTVAVSTGGASPALARAIREELEAVLEPSRGALLEVVAAVRRELRAAGRAPGAEAWRAALDGRLRLLVARGHLATAARYLRRRLESAA